MSTQGAAAASLRDRVTSGAWWMIALRWSDRLVALASVTILARLLTPADFGIVGYAMLLIGLVDLFTQFQTGTALIRDQRATRADYDAAWTLNALRGLLVALAIAALAVPAARYFREPALEPVVLWLALSSALHGFENVGAVDFQKQLTFAKHFRLRLLPRLFSTAVTIALAFHWRDHWALVAGTLAQGAALVVVGYAMHPYRPRLNWRGLGRIARFSGWMTLQALFHGVADRLPSLVLGRLGDASALALFSTARELASVASTELKTPIRAALFPGLARIAGDPANLRASLVEATGVLTLIALPLSLGVALTADDLVPLLLGERWLEIIPLLRVLACAGALLAFGTNSHLVLLALDQPHLVAITTGLRLLILLPLSLFLIPAYGAIGAAYALLIAAACTLVGEYMMSSWRLGIPWTRFAAVVWRPLLAGVAMAGAVIFLQSQIPQATTLPEHAVRIAALGGFGAAIYVGAALALARLVGARDGAEQRVFTILAAPFLQRQEAGS